MLLVDIDMRYSDVGKVADAVDTSTLFFVSDFRLRRYEAICGPAAPWSPCGRPRPGYERQWKQRQRRQRPSGLARHVHGRRDGCGTFSHVGSCAAPTADAQGHAHDDGPRGFLPFSGVWARFPRGGAEVGEGPLTAGQARAELGSLGCKPWRWPQRQRHSGPASDHRRWDAPSQPPLAPRFSCQRRR